MLGSKKLQEEQKLHEEICHSNCTALKLLQKDQHLMRKFPTINCLRTATCKDRSHGAIYFLCDGFFDNFFLRCKAVCSHGVTAICIDIYWNCTLQLHRMGMEPINVWHHTHKCIAVTLYELYVLLTSTQPIFIAVAITEKSHCVNEPQNCFAAQIANQDFT